MGGGCSNTTIGTYHMSMCECDFHDVYSKSSSMSLVQITQLWNYQFSNGQLLSSARLLISKSVVYHTVSSALNSSVNVLQSPIRASREKSFGS